MDTEPNISAPPSSALDRTTQWVQAQAAETYDDVSPPPLPQLDSNSPEQYPQSNRNTSSSGQSFATPPAPVQFSPIASTSMQRSRPRKESNATGMLPFPRSPPGSGYPMPLEMDPPRAEAQGQEGKRGRPKYKRTSSLLNSIKALSQPTVQWKRDEATRRDQPN
ncbi:hypothetical protein IEO21_05947 [Rhodonia placenta]|uniref:Uncharacterized protein n=1 Tax=Rhodonia placenta TaxID=104341 RepID=A0A8H7P115_9APHY|nr:hypothetical protein IEO21_05947 [Postia placenta]